MRFVTRIEVTGDEHAPWPAGALERAVSYFMISQLNVDSVKEACKSLYEIYEWQSANESRLPAPIPAPAVIKAPTVKTVARRTFEIEAD